MFVCLFGLFVCLFVCFFLFVHVLNRWRNKNGTSRLRSTKVSNEVFIDKQARGFCISYYICTSYRIWVTISRLVVYIKYTNQWKLKMNLETCLQCSATTKQITETRLIQRVNKGKQVCWFRILHLIISDLTICCCFYIN